MKTKNKAIGMLAVMAVLALGCGIVGVSKTNSVSAETETGAQFAMFSGASVRIAEDENGTGSGIRFGSYITEEYFANLSDKTNVVLQSTVSATVGGEEKTLTTSWVLKGENAVTMRYDDNGQMKFYHAIMFDDLIKGNSENMTVASALDLTCEMKLTADGSELFPDNGAEVDATRSARIVAYDAYTYGGYASDNTLKAYFGNAETTTLDSADEYVFMEDGTEKLTPTWGEDAKKSNLDLYDGLQKIGVNKEMTSADFTALGKTKNLVAFDAANKPYNVTAMYVTKAIKKSGDLEIFELSNDSPFYKAAEMDGTTTLRPETCVVEGYYVLANNIEYDEAWEGVQHTRALAGMYTTNDFTNYQKNSPLNAFIGTFDGLGHTMEINVRNNGLFGNLFGELKNTGIIAHMSPYGTNTAGHLTPIGNSIGSGTSALQGVVDNCYIKVASVDLTNIRATYTWMGLSAAVSTWARVANTVLELSDGLTVANDRTQGLFWAGERCWSANGFETITNIWRQVENVYLITSIDNWHISGTKVNDTNKYKGYAANDGITENTTGDNNDGWKVSVEQKVRRYASLAEMKEDIQTWNDETNVNVDDFNAYWMRMDTVPVWINAVSVTWNGVEDTLETGKDTTVSANVGGLTVPVTEIITEDTDVLSVDGAKITAVGVGEATYTVKYQLNGVSYSQTFTIEVEQQTVTVEETVELFSAMDGDFDYATVLGTTDAVTKAYQGDTELTVDYDDNKLSGVTPSIVSGAVQPVTVELWTDTAVYTVTLRAYTMVIDETEDFRIFELSTTNPFYDATAATCIVTGYYVLGQDITYEADWVSNQHTVTGYFSGIFDGLGNTMEFNAQAGGLFYSLQYGGTVKNVAAICHLKTGTGSASTVSAGWAPFAATVGGGTASSIGYITGCYIKIAEVNYNRKSTYDGWFGIAKSINTWSRVHSVIVEFDSSITNYDDGTYAGMLWMMGGSTFTDYRKQLISVYCITKNTTTPIGGRQYLNKTSWINNWAENDTADNWAESKYYVADVIDEETGNVTNDYFTQEASVFRFATLEEMATDTTYGATQVGNWKVSASGVEWTDDVQ